MSHSLNENFPKIKAMKCEDLQFNLSMYADEDFTESEKNLLESHLRKCPVCRAKKTEFAALRNDLRNISRPPMPADLQFSVRNSVAAQLNSPQSQSAFTYDFKHWLRFKLMPYAVGTIASLVFTAVMIINLSSARKTAEQAAEIASIKSSAVPVATTYDNQAFSFDAPVIGESELAALRRPVAQDSPTVNPTGALLKATKNLAGGKVGDEEITFVADVFSNGMAQIAQVVEAPRNRKSLEELEKSLQNDPVYAPFVPASMDNRSEVVRVVVKIQLVNIRDTSSPKPASPNKRRSTQKS